MGKFYVVRKGHQPGIYSTWLECSLNVNGFSNAEYKSFSTYDQAMNWYKNEDNSNISLLTIAYTDGSCQKNLGSWAYLIIKNNKIFHEKAGEMPDFPTTNNRSELMAILKVLTDFKDEDLVIYSDSKYAIKCLSEWWPNWKKRGWKKSDGKVPNNLDLIQDILLLQEGRKITYHHVYGHQGNIYNERCDQLAKKILSKVI